MRSPRRGSRSTRPTPGGQTRRSTPRRAAGNAPRQAGRLVLSEGRPTIAMETFVRLMVLKARYGWGYRTLVGEVSDSLHLRRFCRIGLSGRVPDESTIRKLTRRVGSEMVNEITRAL